MKDEQIINALLTGNHLNKEELQRAKGLLYLMQQDINSRVE